MKAKNNVFFFLLIAFVLLGLTPPKTPAKTYKIGDVGPAKGIIFYDKGSSTDGWRYLEAAPVESEWSSKDWGCFNSTSVGTTKTEIGTGKKNTEAILAHCKEKYKAAWLCAELNLNGFNDWFLPSKDELNLIYQNLFVNKMGGGFTANDYWSSSEGSFNTAWMQYFYNGKQSNTRKDPTARVRAIRAF